jgi:hypothetical protein
MKLWLIMKMAAKSTVNIPETQALKTRDQSIVEIPSHFYPVGMGGKTG